MLLRRNYLLNSFNCVTFNLLCFAIGSLCLFSKDEFHQRLRFNRRGLVGMANSGPDDNRSQFFFTLDGAPELDKKHTLFGKVGTHYRARLHFS